MSRTAQRAGRLLAVYVDDGQGRRLLLGDPDPRFSASVITQPIVAATNRTEARALIKALRELSEELPEGEQR